MQVLGIDIETYSDVNLKKCGVYAYTASLHFEILLFAYAVDNEPVQIVDVAGGEAIPDDILVALEDANIIKTAFNAMFERMCLSKWLGKPLKPDSWQCTAVQSAMLGLPFSLEGVGSVLGLDKQKIKEGKELIRYFCVPCKPTKVNGGRTRNLPHHDKSKWNQFKHYCMRDVEVERSIRNKLSKYPISEQEQKVYIIDQEINDRGVLVATNMVHHAIECDTLHKQELMARAKELTGLDNPNSVQQLKGWLQDKGVVVESLAKKDVAAMITKTDDDVKEMLQLRLQLSKTSVKKYESINRSARDDNRVRGLFQFYGANRTGRWAGRLVQVQNLPQNHLVDLELARNLLMQRQYKMLDLLFESVPHLLSELIRTAFIPEVGNRFIVSDFSAIEARVIAWLAGEKWRLEVFKTHGKIYEASASQMFHVPIDEITKTSPLRQKGKIAELALGYGGSVGALTSMGALDMGVKENELQGLVQAWRSANPNITKLWWDVDAAALKAVKERTTVKFGKIKFTYQSGMLFITLPSGRRLAYVKTRIELNKFGREGITYEGVGTNRKWERIDTYGPKLVENIVQATARDLLAEAMLRLADMGYKIVMHVHDEVVIEAPMGEGSLDEVCDVMAIQPEWAIGLPLRADGYECDFYKKD